MKQTPLIFSLAAAAFLTTGVAQAELSNNNIFSLLEEANYPSGPVASAVQSTGSNPDKAALEAIFAMGDESIDVSTSSAQVDMASMEIIGNRSRELERGFNMNQTGFTVIDLNM
ncbi:MAG: hypothetical protein DSZ28_02615 [Thiothrix sp.]|nr:MAG: hypothetical protein DSZ28_02615 [Thiothrix sp.]